MGSNVHIQSFGLGTHGDGSKSTPHIPVSVTGGAFDKFYLSGTYNQDANVRRNDNAECYISGGYFKEAAGACQEQIDGDVHWQIYNADIDAFFGGGINAARPITGHVTTDIYNSHVTLFCGGPKFGDMQSGKKVTTTAEGCVFGKFFGGGYGGTSYSRKKYYDSQSTSWTSWSNQFGTDRGKYFDGVKTGAGGSGGTQYGYKGIGVATDFEYEFFVWSTGGTGGRLYVNFASFSLATCNDVESDLKRCTMVAVAMERSRVRPLLSWMAVRCWAVSLAVAILPPCLPFEPEWDYLTENRTSTRPLVCLNRERFQITPSSVNGRMPPRSE